MKKRLFMFILCILVFISGTVFAGYDRYEVVFLDTGQSDCILIKAWNKNYLIDTGAEYYSNRILNYLNYNRIGKIDTIILTHYHDDHYGGLINIIKNKKVETVFLPKYESDIKKNLYNSIIKNNVKVKYIGKGYKLKNGKVNLKVIGPLKEHKDISDNNSLENNNSLVLQGTIEGIKYLFAGDCEKQEEIDLIESGELKQCDILKLPHHSLNTSSTEGFINLIKPKIAVVTCNGVETPNLSTLKRLHEKGIIIFRTDIRGNVVVKDGFIRGTRDGVGMRIK